MDVLQELAQACDFTVKHLDRFHIAPHQTQMILASLYLSVEELAEGLVHLARKNSFTAFGPTLRSMLEAFVDLINLVDDENYARHMQASNTKEFVRFLKVAVDGENPYASSKEGGEQFAAYLEENKQHLAELKQQGHSPLGARERFERAGLIDMYFTVYNRLCTEGHNNISALIDRHIEVDHDAVKAEIAYKRRRHDGDQDHKITTATHMLYRSGILIHESFGTGLEKKFAERLQQFLADEQEHFGLDESASVPAQQPL